MSMASITRAANDPQLQARVLAAAYREMVFNEDLANTEFGRGLRMGMTVITGLMYPVAVDTEAAYETALMAGRGAPGNDSDVITDASISAAVVAHWPYTAAEQLPPEEPTTP